ncbi:MAG: hypothetical protein ACRDSL_22680 [Pseudonocardiaceae bacterium]
MKRAHPTVTPAVDPTDPASFASAEPGNSAAPEVDQDLAGASDPAGSGLAATDRKVADREGADLNVAAWLAREGLPAETVILVGPRTAAQAPMYTSGQACGLTVLGVDHDPDHDDRVLVFTARWERGSRARLRPFAGELFLELAPVASPGRPARTPAWTCGCCWRRGAAGIWSGAGRVSVRNGPR